NASAPENKLQFPLNLRPLIAGWKLLYLRTGRYQPDGNQNAEWNRGAYLANGLAHCGACHTPRNALGAEERHHNFAGGEAEGWTAYALDATSPAPMPWDAAALSFYLRNGWHRDHGVARGPMSEVTENLSMVGAADARAIATYVASVASAPSDERRRKADANREQTKQAADAHTPGAAIYAAACASCHDGSRPPPYGGIDLARSTGPSGPDAGNVINAILWGLPALDEQRRPIMP